MFLKYTGLQKKQMHENIVLAKDPMVYSSQVTWDSLLLIFQIDFMEANTNPL